MKTLKKIVKIDVGHFNFAEFYFEHNGKKFKVHYEATSSMPCAATGHDWYQSLCIMTNDGTWAQITDAEVLGAVTHYQLYRNRDNISFVNDKLDEAEKIFKKYIEEIYS